jgi:integral membrane protein
MKNPVTFVRIMSLTEAVSYLLLLGIAMPLKYAAGMPKAVSVVGAIHGALFILLCVALLRAMVGANWTWSRAGLVFAASFVPLVPFWLDRRMRAWEAEFIAARQ